MEQVPQSEVGLRRGVEKVPQEGVGLSGGVEQVLQGRVEEVPPGGEA